MIAKVQLKESSIRSLEKNLNKVYSNVLEAGKAAVYISSQEALEYSKDMCPKDTYTLVNTAYGDDPEVKGSEVRVHIGYASPETDQMNPVTGLMASTYAVDVHENPSYYHPTGTYKFLEYAMLESAEFFKDRVSEALKEALSASPFAGV